MKLFKNIRIKKDRKRALIKFSLFEKYIPKNASIVDVGTGSGQFAQLLKEKKYAVEAVDIIDKTNASEITPLIYDGKQLPYENNHFEVGMLITVLHHCPYPDKIFEEVLRVSAKRIFILEDVYNNSLMKYLTWFADSVANFEFIGHPHTNKSEKDWEKLFDKHNLILLHKNKVKVFFIFTQVVYVLEKK